MHFQHGELTEELTRTYLSDSFETVHKRELEQIYPGQDFDSILDTLQLTKQKRVNLC